MIINLAGGAEGADLSEAPKGPSGLSCIAAALCAAAQGRNQAMGLTARTFHLDPAVSSAEGAAPEPEGLRCWSSEA